MTAVQQQTEAGVKEPVARKPRFTAEQKQAVVKAHETWQGTVQAFCEAHGISVASLYLWQRAFKTHGAQGLERGGHKASSPRRARHKGPYSPEQRQKAVEAFQKSGMALKDFAKVWKVTPVILAGWVRRYEKDGARGLLRATSGKRRGRPPLSHAVTDQIVAVKQRFPQFGLKKVRSFLGRFGGLKVSVGSVRKSVAAAGLAPTPGPAPRHKKKIRFFERAKPGHLWQSDWTSFVLPRTQQRVYLIVFLDDHSRYIVSWGLHLGQRSEHVVECLREGMARFGKPTEVLTDQGPQYFAWRGTSEFQQFLKREGIRHVVARSHHPQTLGKCERFWGTVAEEFWARLPVAELADVRVRFSHFVAHYNHFRPHQGIANLVPADRFFGAVPVVRETLEKALSANELHLAVDEPPRRPVYLAGQIGDVPVSLVGEKGHLTFHAADGQAHHLTYDDLGMGSQARKEETDGRNGAGNGETGDTGHESGAGVEAESGAHAEGGVQAPTASGAGEGAAAAGESGGAADGASDGHDDPGLVAGAEDAGASGQGAGIAGGAGETALGCGTLGDGGGAVEAAHADAQDSTDTGGGPGEALEADQCPGAGAADVARVGEPAAGSAGEQGLGEAPRE